MFPKTHLWFFHCHHSLEYNQQLSPTNGFNISTTTIMISPILCYPCSLSFTIRSTFAFFHVFFNSSTEDQTTYIQLYDILPLFLFSQTLLIYAAYHYFSYISSHRLPHGIVISRFGHYWFPLPIRILVN